jgi:hypothetical protein
MPQGQCIVIITFASRKEFILYIHSPIDLQAHKVFVWWFRVFFRMPTQPKKKKQKKLGEWPQGNWIVKFGKFTKLQQ